MMSPWCITTQLGGKGKLAWLCEKTWDAQNEWNCPGLTAHIGMSLLHQLFGPLWFKAR